MYATTHDMSRNMTHVDIMMYAAMLRIELGAVAFVFTISNLVVVWHLR